MYLGCTGVPRSRVIQEYLAPLGPYSRPMPMALRWQGLRERAVGRIQRSLPSTTNPPSSVPLHPPLQRYLARKKQCPLRALQYAYAQGPMVRAWQGLRERAAARIQRPPPLQALVTCCLSLPISLSPYHPLCLPLSLSLPLILHQNPAIRHPPPPSISSGPAHMYQGCSLPAKECATLSHVREQVLVCVSRPGVHPRGNALHGPAPRHPRRTVVIQSFYVAIWQPKSQQK